jgi:hypothetical protein
MSQEQINALANPNRFGPGAWLVIHTLAFRAKDAEAKQCFIKDMHKICDGLKCHTCKTHCTAYLKEHHIRQFWNVRSKEGEDIGMFKWSWAFHNAVNARLGKKILDFNTAYHLYSDAPETVCTKECDHPEDDHPEPVVTSYAKSSKTFSPKELVENNPLVSIQDATKARRRHIKPYYYRRR